MMVLLVIALVSTPYRLSGDAVDDDPVSQLCGHSITYRIAVGAQAGRKVFTSQTLPASDEVLSIFTTGFATGTRRHTS